MLALILVMATMAQTPVWGANPAPVWCVFVGPECEMLEVCLHVPAVCTLLVLGDAGAGDDVYGMSMLNTTQDEHRLDVMLHETPDCSDVPFQHLQSAGCGAGNAATIHETCSDELVLSMAWECYPPTSLYAPAYAAPEACFHAGTNCAEEPTTCHAVTTECERVATVGGEPVFAMGMVVGPVPGGSRDVVQLDYFSDAACTVRLDGLVQEPCGAADVSPPLPGDNCMTLDLDPAAPDALSVHWDCYALSGASSRAPSWGVSAFYVGVFFGVFFQCLGWISGV